MSLTVVDGDFPRDVIARKNLQFAEYQMPARRNSDKVYDAKTKRGAGSKPGVLLQGAINWDQIDAQRIAATKEQPSGRGASSATPVLVVFGLLFMCLGIALRKQRQVAG